MRGLHVGALFSVLLGACAGSESVTCDDGTVCPSTLTCAPNGGCASTIQIASCESRTDGDSCSTGAGQGSCNSGICIGSQCGNGVLDEGELCDTSVALSEGECRSDCRAVEVCGNGVVDGGEQCDDENQNDADGCTTECVRSDWVGTTLYGGGGVLAANAELFEPSAVFIDDNRNLYIAAREKRQIFRVDALTNFITVVAGAESQGSLEDNIQAKNAQLSLPKGVFVDSLGDVYIADRGTDRVRRVDVATGLISTVAGGGEIAGGEADGEAATDAKLVGVYAVFVMGNGDFYIVESGHEVGAPNSGEARIRFVSAATGIITTVAGGGVLAPEEADGDVATKAKLRGPSGIYVTGVGRDAELYIAERNAGLIRHVGSDGIITTVAGGGSVSAAEAEGGLATLALLSRPTGVVVVGKGASAELYISVRDPGTIRHVDSDGIITTIAGGGDLFADAADGGLATSAILIQPAGISVVGTGENAKVYIAERLAGRIRLVDSSGIITTVAGGRRAVASDGLATSARLFGPQGIVAVGTGTDAEFYIGDGAGVRHVDSSGVITTVAGGGDLEADDAEGGLATNARFRSVSDIAVVGTGANVEFYIVDSFDGRIWHVGSDGIITTVAGGGTLRPDDADGGLATSAELRFPYDVEVVGAGADAEFYIAENNGGRIRHVDSDGVITTVAGGGTLRPDDADGGLATSASLFAPRGVSVVGTGAKAVFYIAEAGFDSRARIRYVDSDGVITTVAGGGELSPADADGSLATMASLRTPNGIAAIGAGADTELYIADSGNGIIRHVDSAGIITTVMGTGARGSSGDGGSAAAAQLLNPVGLSVVSTDAGPEFYVADRSANRIRRVDSAGITRTVAGETYSVTAGQLATEGVGTGSDPQSVVVRDSKLLLAGGESGTVQEVDLANQTLEVLAGRYLHEEPTADFARLRGEDFGAVNGVAYNQKDKLIYLTEIEGNRVHVVTTDDPANGVDPGDSDTWTIAVLAGDGTSEALAGHADGALATSLLDRPEGLFFNEVSQVLYVADTGNQVLRAINVASGTVSTIAGTVLTRGYLGDGGPAVDALLREPVGVTECPNGDLFIAEVGSHHVRRIEASTGIITTVLGVGIPGSSGAGFPATIFPVDSPRGLACDSFGNVFVTSTNVLRLLPAADPIDGATTGIVDGTGSVQTIYQNSAHQCLTGVAVKDPSDTESPLFVTDSCSGSSIELERVVQ